MLEHSSMIWHQFQAAKREGRDLHILILDLANIIGSIPHFFIWVAFNFFHIPNTIPNLVKNYFQDLQFCVKTTDYTTSWQPLEVGIMAGCTIAHLIKASKWVVGGERLKCGKRLPSILAYVDDMTTCRPADQHPFRN